MPQTRWLFLGAVMAVAAIALLVATFGRANQVAETVASPSPPPTGRASASIADSDAKCRSDCDGVDAYARDTCRPSSLEGASARERTASPRLGRVPRAPQ